MNKIEIGISDNVSIFINGTAWRQNENGSLSVYDEETLECDFAPGKWIYVKFTK